MNEQMKTLLTKLKLSEETVTEIKTMLEAVMDTAKAEGLEESKAEIEELKESHEAEIAFLKEKAEEYGVFLKEQANNYGDHLKEKANDYGDYLKGKANLYGEHIKEAVSDKMKEYADYAVENFITENRDRFVETEEYARMKSAFGYIREAFEKNAFDVREDAQVSELKEALAESTRQYEALFEDMAETKELLEQTKKEKAMADACDDLADTQKEKVKELAEAVSFDSFEEYKEGLSMLVEQVRAASKARASNKDEVLTERTEATTGKQVDSTIAAYMTRPGLF